MFDTTPYEVSHGSKPAASAEGLWIFRNSITGRQIERTGVWSKVKNDLLFSMSMPSAWKLLP
jgi:hypothetical protein